MSANRTLGFLPIAGISRAIAKLAAGLQYGVPDVMDLRVDQVCLRFLSMLRIGNPLIETGLKTCLPFLLLGYGISRYLSKLSKAKTVVQKTYSSFLAHINVPGLNPLNQQVCAWMVKNKVGMDSRSLTVTNGSNTVSFLPAMSSSAWFKFNGTWLKFTRGGNDDEVPERYVKTAKTGNSRSGGGLGLQLTGGGKADDDVNISCFSFTGNIKPIKQFLEHVKANSQGTTKDMTTTVRWTPDTRSPGDFDPRSMLRPTRKLDSVSMEAAKKTSLINDINTYLRSQSWYTARGIPWRRGYLFYGPPGSGKTSVSCALAGEFNIPLHIISLSFPGMTDRGLQEIFDQLPTRCVVLLEDIDSAGIGRESSIPTGDTAKAKGKATSSVTLSGLLNAIDGPCSVEGRVLVLTTNSPDSLDPALVRPGRIDMKLLLGNASAEVSESLFLHIFEDPNGNASEHDLAAMAKEFAAVVPNDQLSPAEVQSYLLLHRWDPVVAIEGAADWVKGLIATKSQGGNVESFSGQI